MLVLGEVEEFDVDALSTTLLLEEAFTVEIANRPSSAMTGAILIASGRVPMTTHTRYRWSGGAPPGRERSGAGIREDFPPARGTQGGGPILGE
jgi:hypothetical protein